MIENKESNNNMNSNIYKVALLVSIACVLQISESLIPHPIPGLRLGLANTITLIALVNLGFRYGLEVTILRTVLSSFIMGSFMSPTFILSFSGGVISTLIMAFLFWLARLNRRFSLSIIGISIVGALSHNIVQLYLAYFILVKHPGIFVFLPWLCIGAVIMGWVTGIVAGRVCLKLKEMERQGVAARRIQIDYSGLVANHYFPGNSLIHRLPAQIKIASIFILSLLVLIFNNLWLYAGLFLFLTAMTAISLTSFNFLFCKAKKYTSLMFVSFLFPVFFNSGKHVLSHIAYFKITAEGLSAGVIFALRILFLILASALLVRTTHPKDLTQGLAKILSPLKPLGISGERISNILSLAWVSVPVFGEMTRGFIRNIDLKQKNNLRNLTTLFSDFIVTLYIEADQITTILGKEE